MKKGILILTIIIVLSGVMAGCSFLTPEPVILEENNFTVELPGSFYEDTETTESYLSDSELMFFQWHYFDNEFGLDAEGMLHMMNYIWLEEDDIRSIEEVRINGEDAYQCEYKTLDVGNNGVHYYYEGLLVAFKLEEEFIVFDIYKVLDEEVGINSDISDEDMEQLESIANAIEITDDDDRNLSVSTKEFYGDKLTLELTNLWSEDSSYEAGYYEAGYFSFYVFDLLAAWLDVSEYNDDNLYNLEEIKALAADDSTYIPLGDVNFAGEAAVAYAYNGYQVDTGVYACGVKVFSEHYDADMYFYTFEDEYELSDDAMNTMLELILAAK